MKSAATSRWAVCWTLRHDAGRLIKETLPKALTSRLAVMRLDGEYYESTMHALTNLL